MSAALKERIRRDGRNLGGGILKAAPYFMKALSIAGTVAMFLVGGGILTHGIPPLHHLIEAAAKQARAVPTIGGVFGLLAPLLSDALAGLITGAAVVGAVTLVRRALPPRHDVPSSPT